MEENSVRNVLTVHKRKRNLCKHLRHSQAGSLWTLEVNGDCQGVHGGQGVIVFLCDFYSFVGLDISFGRPVGQIVSGSYLRAYKYFYVYYKLCDLS